MLQINRNSNTPIYQQIYNQIKNDILSGNITVNTRITSTRELAKELQVGRNSVENAYDQLRLEGYINSVPGSGYIVNNIEFDLNHNVTLSVHRNGALTETPNYHPKPKIKYNFQYGGLDTATFPQKLWRTYMTDLMDDSQSEYIHAYSNSKGDFELRAQIRQYLYRSRGVNCDTEQIVLCSGTQAALEIILKIFKGDKKIAMEDPCYNGSKVVFQNNGFQIMPVPVHTDGIDLQILSTLSAPLIHVTPSHQFPTGAIMPINNRMELLNLAYKQNSIIIEDDYDSEFRYKGHPIPSLQSIDQTERVIYTGTFSKALSPGLRTAYLVLPKWMLSDFDRRYEGYTCTVSLLEQRAIFRFMQEGHWEKHLRRICLSQKKKHDILINAIEKIMGDHVQIYGHNAGLHIWLEIKDGQTEEELVRKALKQGICVCPASSFWLNSSNYSNNAILLGFGKIAEKDILPAVKLLNESWFHN